MYIPLVDMATSDMPYLILQELSQHHLGNDLLEGL